ncbi:hypothetical protein T08_11124 [Trichinella sp. T8]|nr:hypothetical protein T08_11124 [Trichinella sp. T8]
MDRKEGWNQSDSTNPLQEETKWELTVTKSKHGILEVHEETDCTGITSVKRKISFLSLSQSQDQEEEIDKKRELEENH